MGHEDWDLSAIVRSCKAPNANNNSTEEAPTNSNTGLLFPQDTSSANNAPFSSFPNLMQSRTNAFQELHQLLETFNPTTTATTSTSAPGGINIPNSPPFPDFSPGSIAQHHHHSPSVLVPTTNYASIGASTSASFDRFHHHHQQQQQHHQQHQQQQPQPQEQKQHNQSQVQVPQTSSVALLPNTQSSQTPRSRKRKSLQKKMVCHVTADNLSADLWAWRKYGQKPIKGSPYPRNYYRCSSCKGCVARKQVERSLTDPGMFVVTYTGDHRHAKPVHRNSLAGSTRNKTTRSATTTTQPDPHSKAETSMNSSNFLQVSTQTTTSHQEDVVSGAAEDSWREGDRVTEQELGSSEEEDDEDDVLIPNDTAALSETVFLDPITFTAEVGDGKTSPRFNGSDPSTKPD